MNVKSKQDKQKLILAVLVAVFLAVVYFMFLKGDAAPPPASTPPSANAPQSAEPAPAPQGETGAAPRQNSTPDVTIAPSDDDTFPGSGPVRVTRNPFAGTPSGATP